jgi:hypothetical protein
MRAIIDPPARPGARDIVAESRRQEEMKEQMQDDLAPPREVDVGLRRGWTLPLDNLVDGPSASFTGRFLGFGTTHRETHINHDATEFAPKGVTCSGCRWFEARIFRADDGRFALYTVGESVVPGEDPRYRLTWCVSPYEVIDLLTTFRDADDGHGRKSYLNVAARRVLAQAAGFDDVLRDAYEGRLGTL